LLRLFSDPIQNAFWIAFVIINSAERLLASALRVINDDKALLFEVAGYTIRTFFKCFKANQSSLTPIDFDF
jgi:hypothetical protein